eukprot:gene32740-42394_t
MIVQEEIEVLKSIYSDNCITVSSDDYGINGLTIIYRHDQKPSFGIYFRISEEYPEKVKPQISFDWEKNKALVSVQGLIQTRLDEIMDGSFGEVVLYSLIEAVKEIVSSSCSSSPEEEEKGKEIVIEDDYDGYYTVDGKDKGNADGQNATYVMAPTPPCIVHGPVTVEQKSSFQSHVAAVRSMEEVLRFRSASRILHHDCDDDGETAAGARLAELLRLMHLDGVAVIVSRWFGGVLLGPDRFRLISNSARALLTETGFGANPISAKEDLPFQQQASGYLCSPLCIADLIFSNMVLPPDVKNKKGLDGTYW